MEKGNIMTRKDTVVDNVLISLVDSWNEDNIVSKINPEFINSLKLHIDNTYTVAVEDTFRKINREFKKHESTNISLVLMKQILNPKTYEL